MLRFVRPHDETPTKGEVFVPDPDETGSLPDEGEPIRRVVVSEFLDARTEEPSYLGPAFSGQEPGDGQHETGIDPPQRPPDTPRSAEFHHSDAAPRSQGTRDLGHAIAHIPHVAEQIAE